MRRLKDILARMALEISERKSTLIGIIILTFLFIFLGVVYLLYPIVSVSSYPYYSALWMGIFMCLGTVSMVMGVLLIMSFIWMRQLPERKERREQ